MSSNAPFAPYCACVAEFVATAPESAVVSGTKMSLLTGVTVIDVARSAAGLPTPQKSVAEATSSRSSSADATVTSCHVFQSCGVNVTDATSAVTAGTPPPVMCTDAVTAAEGCAASLKRATAVPPSGTDTVAFSATTTGSGVDFTLGTSAPYGFHFSISARMQANISPCSSFWSALVSSSP